MGDAVSLGDALKKFLDKSRIKENIQSLQIEDHWTKVMGETIANMTDKVEIRNGTLFIHSSVAPLKNELVFQKDLIVQRINESMGEAIVREVVIL
jgi:predicted nucleic acid-binding Zn ribbon protein